MHLPLETARLWRLASSRDGTDVRARRFGTMFDASYRPLFAYVLRRVMNRDDAEDIVAEVYLIAWRRIGDVPQGIESLPWLIGVARRVLANSRRSDSRRDRLLAKLKQQAASAPDDIDLPRENSALTAALAALRPADVEVLQLAAWERLPHDQIAVVLGCTVNAVGIRLHRARRALRIELEKGQAQSVHGSATVVGASATGHIVPGGGN